MISSRPAILICLLLVTAGLLFSLSKPVRAQSYYGDSSGEEVAIAFFHAADTNPNFDKWARGGKAFKKIAPARVEQYLYDEKQRLMREWQDYKVDTDLINVRLEVTIDIKSTTQPDGSETFGMSIRYNDGVPAFFPFEYQDYKFAIVPQKLETMVNQTLHKVQYDLIRREIENKPNGRTILYIQLKPVKAYIQQPFKMGDEERWMMLTDIANMAMKSGKGINLWTFSAPWYVSPVTEELRNMYGGAGAEGIEPIQQPQMIR